MKTKIGWLAVLAVTMGVAEAAAKDSRSMESEVIKNAQTNYHGRVDVVMQGLTPSFSLRMVQT
jgi:ribosomal protein L18